MTHSRSQGKQDRRIIEDTDERAGHLVFARNDAGTKVLKGGTKVKLIERIVAYGTVGYGAPPSLIGARH